MNGQEGSPRERAQRYMQGAAIPNVVHDEFHVGFRVMLEHRMKLQVTCGSRGAVL
jgi:hypothetical protein